MPGVHGCGRVHVLGRAISNKLALDIASVPLYYKHTTGTTPLLAPPAVPLRCCRASIAASESAISEGRFQTNLRWTSLGCQWTAIILRVLLRYLPFHYGRPRGSEKNLNSNLGCVKIVSQWRQPGPRQALAASHRCANTCVGGTAHL